MSLPIKNFYGEIDGKTIYDFSRKLDYGIDNQQGRIKYIDKLINTKREFKKPLPDTYFEELFIQEYDEGVDKDKCYWDEEDECYLTYGEYIDKYSRDDLSDGKAHTGKNVSHVKLCLNTSDGVYSESNIAKEIEKMADYILYAPDGERINKKTEYNFYTEEKFKQRLNKDLNLEGALSKSGEDDDERIDFLIRKGNNYKLEAKQKIYEKDFKDKELKDILVPYHELREKLRDKSRTNKNKKQGYIIGNEINLLGKDMIDVKNQLKGTIYFKQPLPDEGRIDYDEFDFFDEEMVKELLRMKPRSDFQNDLDCIIYDLQCIIDKCDFDDNELKIIDAIRNEYDIVELANEFNSSKQNISFFVNKIVKKIINKYEDVYEDWYYLNVVKGRYKKCSKCGEIKIANERHFSKMKNTKDGFRPNCKKCDNR